MTEKKKRGAECCDQTNADSCPEVYRPYHPEEAYLRNYIIICKLIDRLVISVSFVRASGERGL